jgi:hypothetical protein
MSGGVRRQGSHGRATKEKIELLKTKVVVEG